MQVRKEPVSISSIESSTSRSKDYIQQIIEKAEKVKTDPDKDKRVKMSLCQCCYYVLNERIAGAVMTSKPCGICEQEMVFSSTSTDKICLSCAIENGLCKRCGADIELVVRRKKYPFQNILPDSDGK